MNEKYTNRTTEAAELERRAKQLRREETAFLEEVDLRKDELLARWHEKTSDETAILKDLADRYECPIDVLLDYLFTDMTVEYIKKTFLQNSNIYDEGS